MLADCILCDPLLARRRISDPGPGWPRYAHSLWWPAKQCEDWSGDGTAMSVKGGRQPTRRNSNPPLGLFDQGSLTPVDVSHGLRWPKVGRCVTDLSRRPRPIRPRTAPA
jgi:hypothetical protein